MTLSLAVGLRLAVVLAKSSLQVGSGMPWPRANSYRGKRPAGQPHHHDRPAAADVMGTRDFGYHPCDSSRGRLADYTDNNFTADQKVCLLIMLVVYLLT